MSTPAPPPASKASIVKGYVAVVHTLGVAVLLQAIIAGQFLYGEWSIVPHGVIGNVSFILAVAALVLTIVGRLPRPLLVIAAVMVVLLTAQIGMGYSVEQSRSLGAWHIPLGVTIFGLATYQVAAAIRGVGRRATA